MRKLLALALLSSCVDYQPLPPPAPCPDWEVYQYGDDGEPTHTAVWADLCGCPEARPYPRHDMIECLRCIRPDGSHFEAPGGCWSP